MSLVTHLWLECDKCGACSPSADNNESVYAYARDKGWVIGNFTPLSGFGAYGKESLSGKHVHMDLCDTCGKWIQVALDKSAAVTEDVADKEPRSTESVPVTEYISRREEAKRTKAKETA